MAVVSCHEKAVAGQDIELRFRNTGGVCIAQIEMNVLIRIMLKIIHTLNTVR